VLPPEGLSDCDYNPELEAAFPDDSAAQRRRGAAVFQATEALRMARDYALTEEGVQVGLEEITKIRIREARAASAAWKRVADAMAKRRAAKAPQAD
jgi:hypothetical protein